MKKDKAWSFSQLNAFNVCPKRYWHLTIQKDVKEEKGEAAINGQRVHKAFENYVRSRGREPLPVDLTSHKEYLSKFIALPPTTTVAVEMKLALNKDLEPVEWFDRSCWVRAIVDLAVVGKSVGVMVDYKTGKPTNDDLQLKLTSLLLMQYFEDLEVVRGTYYWTRTHKEDTPVPVYRGDSTQLWAEIMPRLNRFQHAWHNDEYPAKQSGLCKRHCPVIQCKFHGG